MTQPNPLSPDSLNDILARVREATGPDSAIDNAIGEALDVWWMPPDENFEGVRAGPYTASLDAALSLVERVLPGWTWRVASCCVSDDAWLMPDYNNPTNGEELKKAFPPSFWEHGFIDVDRRPAGQPALAILQCLLKTLVLIQQRALEPPGLGPAQKEPSQ